jgi:hypothetical protein
MTGYHDRMKAQTIVLVEISEVNPKYWSGLNIVTKLRHICGYTEGLEALKKEIHMIGVI